MIVTVEVAPYLQPFVRNKDRFEVNCASVGDCLSALVGQYPEIEEWLFDVHGVLKVIIIKNQFVITGKDLGAVVCDDDHISIVMPLGGG